MFKITSLTFNRFEIKKLIFLDTSTLDGFFKPSREHTLRATT